MIDEIRGSEAGLRPIIDTIPALVSGFSLDGSNEFFNKKWDDYTGLSLKNLSVNLDGASNSRSNLSNCPD